LFIWVVHRLIVDAKPVFHGSIPNGGNPQEVDVNAQYKGFEYHYTCIICCTFIVWLHLHRLADPSRSWALLWRSFKPKVGAGNAFPVISGDRCHHLSVDVLGIFACLLQDCWAIHWRPSQHSA
jgi:hypothetical protein